MDVEPIFPYIIDLSGHCSSSNNVLFNRRGRSEALLNCERFSAKPSRKQRNRQHSIDKEPVICMVNAAASQRAPGQCQ